MAITGTVIPGKVFAEGEDLTIPKVNALGQPTINFEGALSAENLTPGSINYTHLVPGPYWYGTTAGTTVASVCTTYTLNLANDLPALTDGSIIAFKVHADCAAGSTLNVDGLGAKAIQMGGGVAVAAGDLKIDVIYEARYTTLAPGTWQIISRTPYHDVMIPTSVSGSGDAITLVFNPTILNVAQLTGRVALFVAAHDNTTATTITVNGLTMNVKKLNTLPLVGGEILTGQAILVYNNGTNWLLSNVSSLNESFYVGNLACSVSDINAGTVTGFPSTLTAGLRVWFTQTTGLGSVAAVPVTFTINGVTKNIKKGVWDLEIGDFEPSTAINLLYSGTQWQWVDAPMIRTISGIAIASATNVTVTHGYDTRPRLVRHCLRKAAGGGADGNGYNGTNQDEIEGTNCSVTAGHPAFGILVTNTDVIIQQNVTTANVLMPNRNGGSFAALDNTNGTWTHVLYLQK